MAKTITQCLSFGCQEQLPLPGHCSLRSGYDRMRSALIDARVFLQAELDVRLDSYCLKGPDGKPDISTLAEEDGGCVGEAMDFLARIDSALNHGNPPNEGEIDARSDV